KPHPSYNVFVPGSGISGIGFRDATEEKFAKTATSNLQESESRVKARDMVGNILAGGTSTKKDEYRKFGGDAASPRLGGSVVPLPESVRVAPTIIEGAEPGRNQEISVELKDKKQARVNPENITIRRGDIIDENAAKYAREQQAARKAAMADLGESAPKGPIQKARALEKLTDAGKVVESVDVDDNYVSAYDPTGSLIKSKTVITTPKMPTQSQTTQRVKKAKKLAEKWSDDVGGEVSEEDVIRAMKRMEGFK
ncbi:MAG TPA: hypothetical protein VMW36_10385, partial [Patescibacteria group bacterium]|nr:hypothetical protein [Patescibacteria group bacterium]